MQMNREELEYAISQYIDGILPPLERSALEERLATDAEARAILGEYQQLNSAIKQSMPMPSIQWDRLAEQIGRALDEEEAPTQNYKLHSAQWVRRLAIAAAILLAVGVSIPMLRRPGTNPAPTGLAVISGPAPEVSQVASVEQIQIGPAPNIASNWQNSEDIVARPTIVLIDQVNSSGQDNDLY
ncbi:MAG TPA: hypothetical protein VHD56_16820 [Tepidisphaeraceae bacterium]|nr:hypothetical protein [Tepidisphaeraceae bacterium]